MASGGIPPQPEATDMGHEATALAIHLGKVQLTDSSPVLTAKTPKFTRKYSLRELEIQQTIGRKESVWVPYAIHVLLR